MYGEFFTMIGGLRKITPCFLISLSLWANPSGPTVVHGEVGIEVVSPEHLRIQAGDQAIIDWKTFSIEVGEKTEFVQPRFDSIAINRVLDCDPSRLMGQLQANGTIVLINPNGIIVGKDAMINMASFIASTLDLNGDLYLKTGEISFQGNSEAKIIHEGTIQVENEALFLGRNIENRGTLVSGKLAALIAENNCLLKPSGDRRIFVRPLEGVHMKEGNAFASAFRHSGGMIQAPEVLIQSAETFIDPSAEISASGVGDSSGGSIEIAGAHSLIALGKIAACGGPEGGNGGTIALRSEGEIDFAWRGDLSAPFGVNGTLSLSPSEVYVIPVDAPSLLSDAATAIDPINLSNFLQSQGNVEIRSKGQTTVLPDGNIIWTSPNSLTLSAGTDLSIHANIQNAGIGDISLSAQQDILITPGRASVSIGSEHGGTVINAPSAHLKVLGGESHSAQIGFYTTTAHCTGQIEIDCGRLTLEGAADSPFSGAHIGHGAINAPCGVTTSETPITIRTGGDVSIEGGGFRSPAQVGHGGLHGSRKGAIALEGDISVWCGGNLRMGTKSALAVLGHGFEGKMLSSSPLSYEGNISLHVQGDLQLLPHTAVGMTAEESVFNGDVTVFVAGNLFMDKGHIGTHTHSSSQTRTVVVSSGSMELDGAIVSASEEGGVQIAALKDIVLGTAQLGTRAGITQIYAGGNIRSTPGEGQLGSGDASLIISAGGNIAMPSSVETGKGSIRLNCGRDFKSGNLWESEGARIVSICGQPIDPVQSFLTTSSPAISGLGSYTNTAKVSLTTDSGDLILTCGTLNPHHRETLRIGTQPEAHFELKTNTGNIHLGPFYDLAIDQPLATRGGEITAQAVVDLSVGQPISTDNGLIYLSAGNNLEIRQSVTSSSGKISTFSGNDTTVATEVRTGGEVLMIAGRHFMLKESSAIRSTAGMVTLVADYAPPEKPLLNPGVFIAEAHVRIDSGADAPLRIFTAASEVLGFNQIDPSVRLNGLTVAESGYPSEVAANTQYESWSVRFEPVYPYPGAGLGRPFTIFYKYDFSFLNDAFRKAQMMTSQAHPGLFSYPQAGRRLNVTLLKNTRFPDNAVLSRMLGVIR